MSRKDPSNSELPKEFLSRLEAVTAKRPKTVIDHIIKHGYITTEELGDIYGYNHPPRAARDVREEGIPLETFRVTGSDGRKIAAYKFGKHTDFKSGRRGGRQSWPKNFKNRLVKIHGSRCEICSTMFEPRYLQVDHRVPYEIAGNPAGELKVKDFMPLCGSCNRAKSWSCENCKNWNSDHSVEVCETCYWAAPEGYSHVALENIFRLEIVWKGAEAPSYKHLVRLTELAKKDLPDFVKEVLDNHVNRSPDNE